jgi:hypothetical protein
VTLNINWGLFDSNVDVPGKFFEGMERGRQWRDRRELRNALAAYSDNPNDPVARRTIMALNPQVGVTLEDQAYQRSERERATQARSALSGYLLSSRARQRSAFDPWAPKAGEVTVSIDPEGKVRRSQPPVRTLAEGIGESGSVPFQPSAFGAEPPMGSGMARGAGMVATVPDAENPSPAPAAALPTSAPGQHGTVMLGNTPARPRALSRMPEMGPDNPDWERYVEADPSGAMKVMLSRQDLTKAENEALLSQMEVIARLARGAVDQPSYEAALAEAASLGLNTSHLPREFDPTAVNAMELRALSGKEYLTEQRNDRRLEWDIQDDEFDNARDDRNVDSQVSTRAGQLANTRRGQDLTDARGRRGQDLSDSRGRRGQDMTDARGRRGQDVTDARGRRGQDVTDRRGRDSASFQGRSGKGGRGAGGAVIVNPATGEKMQLKDGKWVAVR